MQWNVAQLLQSSIGTERAFPVEEDDHRYEELSGRIFGTARLMRIDQGILVRAPLSTRVWCKCSRCLVRFSTQVNFEIDEVFYLISEGVHLETGGESEEQGRFTIDAWNTLDLGEPVRQYALLSIPIKPLCTQDCSGLCSTCGVNLKEKTCGCLKDHADPRWASLRELLPNVGTN